MREAKRVWPSDALNCVVSIGSGKLPWQYRSIEAKPPSLFDTMNHVGKNLIIFKSFSFSQLSWIILFVMIYDSNPFCGQMDIEKA